MSWSEDRLHRWLARRPAPAGLAGDTGHDAAVLVSAPGRDVICVDQVIEGVHVEPGELPRRVGAKAACRALSDLAATAAEPRALLLALRAPLDSDEACLRSLLTAVDTAGKKHGAPLVGGDLACAPGPLSLAVTALGSIAAGGRPLSRARARAGQVVVLTGPVGGSALGRHLRIRPRLQEGRWLAECGATAMMDVSDGLAWDLFRLARRAGVRIDLEQVPVHRDARRAARDSGRDPVDHALHDGEDHELLATLPRRALKRVLNEAPDHCPGLVVVGRVTAGRGLRVPADGGLRTWRPGTGGWRHGD